MPGLLGQGYMSGRERRDRPKTEDRRPKAILRMVFCLLSFVFCLLSFCFAQEEAIIVDGDRVEFVGSENKIVAEGNVVIIHKGARLNCNKVIVDKATKDAYATGNVKLEDEGGVILAERMEYNLDTKKGTMFDAHVLSDPIYGRAKRIDKVSQNELVLYQGYFTTCDRERPHYRFKARRMDFFMGEKMTAHNLNFKVFSSTLMHIPKYVHILSDSRPQVTVMPGMYKPWGVYMLSAWRYYFNEGLYGRVHLDYRERKDFAWGVDTKYDTKKFGEGFLRTYYMNERSIESKAPWKEALNRRFRKTVLQDDEIENLDRKTSERERFRISLRHQWEIDEANSVRAEYNRLSDGDFLSDYYWRENEKGASTSSYVLYTRLMPFSSFTALFQKRTNRFVSELEKLPQIKWDISGLEIGETNLYYRGTWEFASLNQKQASPSDSANHVNRIDSYNKLSYPTKVAFLETSPYVAMRQTYYDRDKDSSSEGTVRGVFYGGIDISTKFYRIFDFYTDAFNLDINRLRHIITPTLRYSYVHDPTAPNSKFYGFDGIDSISKSHSMSLGLENKLQTKRGDKSVDLIRFITSSDYTLYPRPAKFGDVKFDFEAIPYNWVRFETDATYDREKRVISTANFDLALTGEKEEEKGTDDYEFFFGLGYRYQRESSNQFTTQLTYRLNPDWKFKVYERWEKENGGLREQEYTIYKTLHCWQMDITYNVRRGYGEAIYLIFRIKAFPGAGLEFNNSYHQPKPGSQSPTR
ncbi:MAG: LPS-assembly protein LptD [Candidatus Omnitrophota bacterium]